MSRDGQNVEHFHLFVPTHRRLNVGEETIPGNMKNLLTNNFKGECVSILSADMEWMNSADADDTEVNIGYMPQMELRVVSKSQEK